MQDDGLVCECRQCESILYGLNGFEGKMVGKIEVRVRMGRWMTHHTFQVMDFATKLILGYLALKKMGLLVNHVEDCL